MSDTPRHFLYVNYHDTHFPYHHRDIQTFLNAPIVSQPDIAPEHAGELRGIDGRIAYDFREGRARVGGDEWQRPEECPVEYPTGPRPAGRFSDMDFTPKAGVLA